jgi:hypothetical protein
MSVAPVASPTIPTHYLRESPEIVARQLDRKAKLWDIAAKVTMAALFAIGTVVLTIAIIGSSTLSTPFALIILGLVLLSPVLTYLNKKFAEWAEKNHNLAEVEHGVAEHLKKIRHWQLADIQAFYETQHLAIEPELAMLPLIARFNYWKERAENAVVEAKKHIDKDYPDNYLQNLARDIRYQTREYGWSLLENEALPAKLQSAVILQLIIQPNQELELPQIGRCCAVTFGQRFCEQLFDNEDSYFEFADGRKPLLATTISDSSPADLRQKLFQ